MKGGFAFNKTPMAPLGTKALAYIDPDARGSWQAHAQDVFYVGREPLHYRLLRFFNEQTKGYIATGTYKLFPVHCRVPAVSKADRTLQAAAELLEALKTMPTLDKKCNTQEPSTPSPPSSRTSKFRGWRGRQNRGWSQRHLRGWGPAPAAQPTPPTQTSSARQDSSTGDERARTSRPPIHSQPSGRTLTRPSQLLGPSPMPHGPSDDPKARRSEERKQVSGICHIKNCNN